MAELGIDGHKSNRSLGPLWRVNRFRMTEERTAFLQEEKEVYTVLAAKIGDEDMHDAKMILR